MTKNAIDILTERIQEAKEALARAEQHLMYERSALAALENSTPRLDSAGQPDPYVCSGCGTKLYNELEFWTHFVVTDRRYPRLGECPIKLAARRD
jgi:hypothetical protein